MADLVRFRVGLRACCSRWGDALFELCDAALCLPGPVASVPSLSLEPVFSRSHGSLYKALARGRIEEDRLLVASRPEGWPLVFAVDASTWDRCDAGCSPERGYYYSASQHSAGQPIVAGWSYQWISQLDWAPDSWTAPLDALRLKPSMDATTTQLRRLVDLLPSTKQIPLFVFDLPPALRHRAIGSPKSTLGWTTPALCSPEQADRWTWLVVTALHPAAPHPRAGQRPAPALGTPQRSRPTHPGPGTQRISATPRHDRHTSRATEIHHSRTRTSQGDSPPTTNPSSGDQESRMRVKPRFNRKLRTR